MISIISLSFETITNTCASFSPLSLHCFMEHPTVASSTISEKSWIKHLSITSFHLIPNKLDTLNIPFNILYIMESRLLKFVWTHIPLQIGCFNPSEKIFVKIGLFSLVGFEDVGHVLPFSHHWRLTPQVTAEPVAPYERPALTKAFPMGHSRLGEIHVLKEEQEIRWMYCVLVYSIFRIYMQMFNYIFYIEYTYIHDFIRI